MGYKCELRMKSLLQTYYKLEAFIIDLGAEAFVIVLGAEAPTTNYKREAFVIVLGAEALTTNYK